MLCRIQSHARVCVCVSVCMCVLSHLIDVAEQARDRARARLVFCFVLYCELVQLWVT